MNKILIRVESHASSGLGGMETRIRDFIKKSNSNITILSNRDLKIYFKNENFINLNYFKILNLIKDIFSFRNYNIIESNGHRDNIISILNYLIFFPFYKIKKIKLFIVIHGVIGIKSNKSINKLIYNIIFTIGILISNKIIFVSEETCDFFKEYFKFLKNIISGKKLIIVNYININKPMKIITDNNLKGILVSRIDNSKSEGIIKTINFCIKNNIILEIYGGGSNLNTLKSLYKNIKFHGEVDNNNINYNNYNICFGMGRSLLEGILKGLIGILVGYEDILDLIELNNIKQISYSNFSGRGIKKENDSIIYEKIIKSLINKKYINIKNEIEKNYSLKNFKDYWN